jgi:CHAT domain-containing protein
MEPLMPFARHRRLVLIPHDALHQLPFAALRNPRTGRYLIEDYTLTIAPSASALGVLRRQVNPWAGRALIVGDPGSLPGELGPLLGARREAEAVAEILGTEPLLGEEATETRVRAQGNGVDLLHLAAHGVYEPRQPLFSYIALAPDEQHDGRLEMHEIFEQVDLSGVNLVVLSACRTALGERTGGDEIVGLVRAFLHAGSPAVLATLWNIDDDASSILMAGFYRRLLAGKPAAEALRQAQLETLHREETASPYYWAGFSLVGDPGFLRHPTGR